MKPEAKKDDDAPKKKRTRRAPVKKADSAKAKGALKVDEGAVKKAEESKPVK